jgi:hypothetical protein
MPSTQPSSDEWDDDAIKTLLAYGGWDLEWSTEDNYWVVYPPEHKIIGTMFSTLQDVYDYYLNYMKWWNDGNPEVPIR